MVRGYHRGNGRPRRAIKLDIMKAYDSVDWNFLFDTMRAMDFPELQEGAEAGGSYLSLPLPYCYGGFYRPSSC